MNASQRTLRFSEKIILEWFLANLIGFAAAGAILFCMAYIMSGGFGSPAPQADQPRAFTQQFLFGGLTGAIIGLILGICQAFVLRPHLKSAGAWIATTLAGFAVGMAVEFVLPPGIHLAWILTGLLLGALQWLILRKQVPKAWSWPVINVAVGIALELLGGWMWGLSLFLFLAAGGVLTGLVIAWLITNQKKAEPA